MRPSELTSSRYKLIQQLRTDGIENESVLTVMEAVPRHEFVDESLLDRAYENRPLSIGEGQTISQPYIVALMTELVLGSERVLGKVLEIGTGCGYQTAVLARLAARVFTVERIAKLQTRAVQTLRRLGFENIEYRAGDGYEGWEQHQPFDAILVTAAPPEVPQKLVEQLAVGGRMVVPVGEKKQYLRVITRHAAGVDEWDCAAVRFVPMIRGTSE